MKMCRNQRFAQRTLTVEIKRNCDEIKTASASVNCGYMKLLNTVNPIITKPLKCFIYQQRLSFTELFKIKCFLFVFMLFSTTEKSLKQENVTLEESDSFQDPDGETQNPDTEEAKPEVAGPTRATQVGSFYAFLLQHFRDL